MLSAFVAGVDGPAALVKALRQRQLAHPSSWYAACSLAGERMDGWEDPSQSPPIKGGTCNGDQTQSEKHPAWTEG
jgi:hypothetical protein